MALGSDPPVLEDSISLRLATEADADGIARTLAASFAPLAGSYTPAAFAATVPPAAVIRARLRDARTWVAVQGTAIVGTVTACVTPTGAYVQSMGVVVPSARRAGVGRRLLDEAVRSAGEAKARRLYLSTTPFLEEAIRLYASCGFSFVPAEGPFDLHGTPLRTMERQLPADAGEGTLVRRAPAPCRGAQGAAAGRARRAPPASRCAAPRRCARSAAPCSTG